MYSVFKKMYPVFKGAPLGVFGENDGPGDGGGPMTPHDVEGLKS